MGRDRIYRTAFGALCVAAVISVSTGAYVWWAHWSAFQLRSAIESRDASRISPRVDWPALRTSLKETFGAIMLASLTDGDGPQDDMAKAGAGLAAAFAPALVNGMIDNYVTPQGLAVAMRRAATVENPANTLTNGNVKRYGFVSATRYEIELGPVEADQADVAVVLRPRGLVWKVTEVVPKKSLSELSAAANLAPLATPAASQGFNP